MHACSRPNSNHGARLVSEQTHWAPHGDVIAALRRVEHDALAEFYARSIHHLDDRSIAKHKVRREHGEAAA